MIVEKCNSYDGDCPCLDCDNLYRCDVCTLDKTDTELLCKRAREYCERVNGDGRD